VPGLETRQRRGGKRRGLSGGSFCRWFSVEFRLSEKSANVTLDESRFELEETSCARLLCGKPASWESSERRTKARTTWCASGQNCSELLFVELVNSGALFLGDERTNVERRRIIADGLFAVLLIAPRCVTWKTRGCHKLERTMEIGLRMMLPNKPTPIRVLRSELLCKSAEGERAVLDKAKPTSHDMFACGGHFRLSWSNLWPREKTVLSVQVSHPIRLPTFLPVTALPNKVLSSQRQRSARSVKRTVTPAATSLSSGVDRSP